MLNFIESLGQRATQAIANFGYAFRLLLALLVKSTYILRKPRLLLRELYFNGFLSLLIISISGVFVGMVLGLQGYETVRRFNSTEIVGVIVALSLVRELGPVVAALLFASRAGSAMTAEIGLMKTTDQLQAMDMMAVDPVARVVAPRFWGGFLSLPVLAVIFSAVGIYGGWLVAVPYLGVDDGAFWAQVMAQVDFRHDVVNGIIKSIVFGWVVAWIAVYQGYAAKPTAEGVSAAITRTVVISAMAVLGMDLALTALMFRGA